jgi:hypothetical protein
MTRRFRTRASILALAGGAALSAGLVCQATIRTDAASLAHPAGQDVYPAFAAARPVAMAEHLTGIDPRLPQDQVIHIHPDCRDQYEALRRQKDEKVAEAHDHVQKAHDKVERSQAERELSRAQTDRYQSLQKQDAECNQTREERNAQRNSPLGNMT